MICLFIRVSIKKRIYSYLCSIKQINSPSHSYQGALSNQTITVMKKFLTCYIVLLMCTAQPIEASKWRYLLPPVVRSLRQINNQPKVLNPSNTVSGSEDSNPWNYIMPCILLAGGAYLFWLVFKEEESRSTSTLPPRTYQSHPTSFTPHEIILANGGGVLLR